MHLCCCRRPTDFRVGGTRRGLVPRSVTRSAEPKADATARDEGRLQSKPASRLVSVRRPPSDGGGCTGEAMGRRRTRLTVDVSSERPDRQLYFFSRQLRGRAAPRRNGQKTCIASPCVARPGHARANSTSACPHFRAFAKPWRSSALLTTDLRGGDDDARRGRCVGGRSAVMSEHRQGQADLIRARHEAEIASLRRRTRDPELVGPWFFLLVRRASLVVSDGHRKRRLTSRAGTLATGSGGSSSTPDDREKANVVRSARSGGYGASPP
jgi:hypothetical protein